MFEADRAEVRILVDNLVDMLLPPVEGGQFEINRWGLIEHFDVKRTPPQAEMGISFLVRIYRGDRVFTTLFDCGLTDSVLLHNAKAFSAELAELDHVVISHGHPDHYGGVYGLLKSLGRPIGIVTHPDAFLPRYAVMGDGCGSPNYNNALDPERLKAAGGRVVLTRDPIELGSGTRTTGEIPRRTDFEGPRPPAQRGAPGLYQVSSSGNFGLDEVMDEQALVIDVRDVGLIVLTGCAHAGVINTLQRALELCGDRPIAAVLGGFHLGFPTTPAENVERTAAELQRLRVQVVVPMHCSGLRTHGVFAERLKSAYISPSVGTTFRFGS